MMVGGVLGYKRDESLKFKMKN